MRGSVVMAIPAALGTALPYGRLYVDWQAAAAEKSIMTSRPRKQRQRQLGQFLNFVLLKPLV
jgi:hypothetical protein